MVIVEEFFIFSCNRSSGDKMWIVAQRIKERGSKPRCQGFESLLAHNRPKRDTRRAEPQGIYCA
ncbi:hypothetical protein P3L10_016670 [Capsicum annuum]